MPILCTHIDLNLWKYLSHSNGYITKHRLNRIGSRALGTLLLREGSFLIERNEIREHFAIFAQALMM